MRKVLFVCYVLFMLVVINLWSIFAHWFVRTEGNLAGLLFIAAILIATPFLAPYLDPPPS
jgi:sorbitol-specific phosphotransferase system component IIBC